METPPNSMMSYVDEADGKTYYSWDEGKTWTPLTDQEYDTMFPTPDVTWWTYDEYKAWLDNEKIQLQDMIGEESWNPTRGWYTWTQADVDISIALYDSILEDIKNEIMVSKSVDGDENLVISYNPQDFMTKGDFSLYIGLDNGEEVVFGPYDTKEELSLEAVPYCEEQVKLGNMTQQEADEIIGKFQ